MEQSIELKPPVRNRRENVYFLAQADRIVVRNGGKTLFIPMNEILWIEADGENTRFHIGSDCYTVNQGITLVEQRLASTQFVRIHKSTIVNLSSVREIFSWFRGDYKVVLRDGTELSCSRPFKLKLDQLIETLSIIPDRSKLSIK